MPMWECVLGASISFVGHKTSGRTEEPPDTVVRKKRHEYPNIF